MGDVCQYTMEWEEGDPLEWGPRPNWRRGCQLTCTSTEEKGKLHQKVQTKRPVCTRRKRYCTKKKETKVAPGRMSNNIALKTNLMFLPQLALIRDIISLKFVRWRFETHNYRHFQSLLPEHRWPRWIWFMKLTQSRFSSNFKSSEKLIPFEIVLSVDNHFTFAWTWNGWGAYSSQLL